MKKVCLMSTVNGFKWCCNCGPTTNYKIPFFPYLQVSQVLLELMRRAIELLLTESNHFCQGWRLWGLLTILAQLESCSYWIKPLYGLEEQLRFLLDGQHVALIMSFVRKKQKVWSRCNYWHKQPTVFLFKIVYHDYIFYKLNAGPSWVYFEFVIR